jgi:hypothetical protein
VKGQSEGSDTHAKLLKAPCITTNWKQKYFLAARVVQHDNDVNGKTTTRENNGKKEGKRSKEGLRFQVSAVTTIATADGPSALRSKARPSH